MRQLHRVGICLFVSLLLSACSYSAEPQEPQAQDQRAQILEVTADLPQNEGWWIVRNGTTTMTLQVKALNTETVLFWAVPTGTETWGERELIGYDLDGSDGWSFTWDFGKRSMHDRIVVQALGSDETSQAQEMILVTAE
ncbi:MAG: hypothetical protein E6Y08_08725 [Paenibacillus sp.]|uniref:hypothetical protein n=1 Tax=Paenibacillus sp. TaxID=58172 RepID=UPI00290BF948|nr:hypothetical protein [Paenibacillus sp.]MDU4695887.1 hypothetical protein [Paenibacillus sp.]